MTEQEVLDIEKTLPERKIQRNCVLWYRDTFPDDDKILFTVPNGGWRGSRAGAMMVYEGLVKGVADLILLTPSGGKASLCIEMKTPKGRQSPEQKAWQAAAEKKGNKYVVCHGLVEFVTAVCNYLEFSPAPYIQEALNKFPLYLYR